jgi:hypothetical protein
MNRPLIGIMVASSQQRKRILMQYLRYTSIHIQLICFTPSSIDWKRKSVTGLYRLNGKWVQARLPIPRAIYNRCYKTDPGTLKRLEGRNGGIKCFNEINQFNKNDVYQILSETLHPYLPETVPYDADTAARLLETHRIIYVKPYYGNKGRGVYRVEMKDSGEIHIGQHYFLPKAIVHDLAGFQQEMNRLLGSTPYIIQKGVSMRQVNERNFDIRLLAQKTSAGTWAVTNIVSRIANKGCFNTSFCEYICVASKNLNRMYSHDEVQAILQTIHDVGLQAAATIEAKTGCHLGELSVDFAIDTENRIWIIEANGMPQKDIYHGVCKRRKVYYRPIEYAQFLSRR